VPDNFKREINKIAESGEQKSREEKLAEIVVDTSQHNNFIHITHIPLMNSPAKRSSSTKWVHTGCL
jgi:hypothetical protein